MPRARKQETREALQDRLLLSLLPHVAKSGFSEAAILAGAADAGIDESRALSLFPDGPGEIINHFMDWADRAMVAALQKQKLDQLKVRARIGAAVRTRLELLEPYREAVKASVAHELRPLHAPGALRALYSTVDAIWIAAGDTATDFNFYTKRLLLAGVYSSTLACWLRDSSDGYEKTWAFLDRRIENVMRIGKFTGQVKARVGSAKARARGMVDRIKGRRAA